MQEYLLTLNTAEIAYILVAVERMAPLAHRPEATLHGGILAKIRALLAA